MHLYPKWLARRRHDKLQTASQGLQPISQGSMVNILDPKFSTVNHIKDRKPKEFVDVCKKYNKEAMAQLCEFDLYNFSLPHPYKWNPNPYVGKSK